MYGAYFDVHVFDELFLPGRKFSRQLPRLTQLVAANELQVFGSATQFEELFGLLTKGSEGSNEYRLASSAALDLIGNLFLRPLGAITDAELRKRNSLTVAETCVSGPELDELRGAISDPQWGLEAHSEVRAQRSNYQHSSRQLETEVLKRLSDEGIELTQVRKEARAGWTVDKAEVDKWIVSSESVRRVIGDRSPEDLLDWHLPVLRSFYAYAIARARRHLRHDRAAKASDLGDWTHYACAAVGSILVTEDRDLQAVTATIGLPYVKVLNCAEFFEMLP